MEKIDLLFSIFLTATNHTKISIMNSSSGKKSREPSIIDDTPYVGLMYAYNVDDVWYHTAFPRKWAETHLPGTGPCDCPNCANWGSLGDLFIGYCMHCASMAYNGKRGRGFIGAGKESNNDVSSSYPSAYDTYLVGLKLSSDGRSLRSIYEKEEEIQCESGDE